MGIKNTINIKVVIDMQVDHYPEFEEIQKIAEEEVLKGNFKTEVSYVSTKGMVKNMIEANDNG